MKQVFHQFSLIWRELGLNQKISILCISALVIGGLTTLVLWSNKPQMKLLYGGLAEKEAGEVLAALEEFGIKYEIGGGGRSIYVAGDQVYKARMDLAAKGLPTSSGGVGFEIFDRTNFGISDFVQRTNYFRALQGELSRTISQLSGVRSARVLVVVPENRLLLRGDETRPTASVFVDTGTNTLNLSSVSSIRSLVANSVQGLSQQDVSVVDNLGQVLSEELNSDPFLASSSSQIKYRQQIENYLSNKVETMLATVLGAGSAVVRVSAEVNSEIATILEEKFDPENQVARTENIMEDSTSTLEKTDGVVAVGVGANVPQQPATDPTNQPTKNSVTTKTSRTQNFEINRTTTNTTKNPGTITRITAAVFLRPPTPQDGDTPAAPRTPEETNTLRQMVANALGVTARTPEELDRLVSITELPFAPVADLGLAPESGLSNLWDFIGPAAALLLAGTVFLVFFWAIHKTKPEQITFELIEEDSPQLNLLPQAKDHKISPELLNDLIRQKPENVSATIREWLSAKPGIS
jgi:flagellar M-ring protein FliF